MPNRARISIAYALFAVRFPAHNSRSICNPDHLPCRTRTCSGTGCTPQPCPSTTTSGRCRLTSRTDRRSTDTMRALRAYVPILCSLAVPPLMHRMCRPAVSAITRPICDPDHLSRRTQTLSSRTLQACASLTAPGGCLSTGMRNTACRFVGTTRTSSAYVFYDPTPSQSTR